MLDKCFLALTIVNRTLAREYFFLSTDNALSNNIRFTITEKRKSETVAGPCLTNSAVRIWPQTPLRVALTRLYCSVWLLRSISQLYGSRGVARCGRFEGKGACILVRGRLVASYTCLCLNLENETNFIIFLILSFQHN